MRRIGREERRARLAVRHHLAPAALADDPVEVARHVVGLHGTDPASVYLAVWARLRNATVASIEAALYEERSLIRMLGMRRTMFVEPIDLAGVVHAACTRAIAFQQRKLLVQLLEKAGVAADPSAWLARVEESTVRQLGGRRETLAADLTGAVPELGTKLRLAEGKAYEAEVNIVTRVLLLLAADGRIVRGRPRGSWISSQVRWSTIEDWLPEGFVDWSAADAQAELVRRWLARFGPGTANDIRWWTGWTMGATKRALAAVGAAEVDLDGATGMVLPDDIDSTIAPDPWICLLPALDPTVMGWADREWYLGEHRRALFDTNGNAGPTIWADGRVVGGWAQRKDGTIAIRLLEDVGREATADVDDAADRLAAWIGDVRVTPRFRTPLERQLSG